MKADKLQELYEQVSNDIIEEMPLTPGLAYKQLLRYAEQAQKELPQSENVRRIILITRQLLTDVPSV